MKRYQEGGESKGMRKLPYKPEEDRYGVKKLPYKPEEDRYGMRKLPYTPPSEGEKPSYTPKREKAKKKPLYKKGGAVKSSASRRADGIAKKGKTRGRII